MINPKSYQRLVRKLDYAIVTFKKNFAFVVGVVTWSMHLHTSQ